MSDTLDPKTSAAIQNILFDYRLNLPDEAMAHRPEYYTKVEEAEQKATTAIAALLTEARIDEVKDAIAAWKPDDDNAVNRAEQYLDDRLAELRQQLSKDVNKLRMEV